MVTVLCFESAFLALFVGIGSESWLAGLGTFAAIWILGAIPSWPSVLYGLFAIVIWGRLGYQLGEEISLPWAIAGAAVGAGASALLHAVWFQKLFPSFDPFDLREPIGSAAGVPEHEPAVEDTFAEIDAEPDPYEILEVEPGASADELRHAYRRRIAEYHPDRVASLGAKLRQVAEEQSKAINWAYDALGRARPSAPPRA